MNEDSKYSFTVVRGGGFAREFVFEQDEIGTPVNLSGKLPRFLVKYGNAQTLEWTVSGGQVSIVGAATAGRIQLSLSASAINAFSFRSANYFLFLNNTEDLVLEGTVTVK